MSQSSNYWAAALQGSPGSQLASMQAKLYEIETTERLTDKFDAKDTALQGPDKQNKKKAIMPPS